MQPISAWNSSPCWKKASHSTDRAGEPPTSLAWSAYKNWILTAWPARQSDSLSVALAACPAG